MSSNNCTKTVTKSCTIGTSGLNCTITGTTKCDIENKNSRTPRTTDFFTPSLGSEVSSSSRESLMGAPLTLRESFPTLRPDVYQSLLETRKNHDDLMRGFGTKW